MNLLTIEGVQRISQRLDQFLFEIIKEQGNTRMDLTCASPNVLILWLFLVRSLRRQGHPLKRDLTARSPNVLISLLVVLSRLSCITSNTVF